jgi:site-specific recombinase XerD
MALNLYRRHRRECQGGHPEESRSGDFEERKKGWKRCACPIFASGTLEGKFRRQTTGEWEWVPAKAVVASWEAAKSWSAKSPTIRVDTDPKTVSVEYALSTFMAELAEHAAPGTQKQYRLMLKSLAAYSAERGFVNIDQWETLDVRQFRSSWPVCAPTAARRMAMVKPFFEYCLSNEWISRNPARTVKNPKGREAAEQRQRLPFADEELKRMYDACTTYGQSKKHRWNGEDLADFISLSIYTGLRISDVAMFHVDRMNEAGEIRVRKTKSGTHVNTWVPQWLQDRIRARAKSHGSFIFGEHTTKDNDVITDGWRKKLQALWKTCGPWQVTPHPHRFRHTFVRILLQQPGVTVRDVAELLGNTEAIILKHYSAWVPARQQRLTRILQDAFEEKPKGRVIPMERYGNR